MITKPISSFLEHNTSSSPSYSKASFPALFTGSTNHNGTILPVNPLIVDDSENAASPMVISNESMRALMPPGWAGRIMQHAQLWWGTGSHPNIGYSNTDPVAMAAIMTDMANRGVDVVVPDWFGPSVAGACNDAVVDMVFSSIIGTGLMCAVMIDQQYLADNGFVASTYQTGVITAINHISCADDQHFSLRRHRVGQCCNNTS